MNEALKINEWAQSLGWSIAGACDPELSESTKNLYEKWITEFKGEQMSYLERRKKERLDPKAYFKDAQSILCFGLYYFPGWAEGEVKISNYAWGKDYHLVLKEKLEETAKKLQEKLGPFKYRVCIDTAPVLEKTLATKAGLGWQGKNTLLIHPKHGSYLFLGEIITSLPLSGFVPSELVSDHCGTCTRCIEACPTDALQPYVLEAEKCISYWTLEHKGPFNQKTPSFDGWIAGCDICQEVCPWNQKLIPLSNTPSASYEFKDLRQVDIRSENWALRIKDKALNYVPEKNWKRNLEHIE